MSAPLPTTIFALIETGDVFTLVLRAIAQPVLEADITLPFVPLHEIVATKKLWAQLLRLNRRWRHEIRLWASPDGDAQAFFINTVTTEITARLIAYGPKQLLADSHCPQDQSSFGDDLAQPFDDSTTAVLADPPALDTFCLCCCQPHQTLFCSVATDGSFSQFTRRCMFYGGALLQFPVPLCEERCGFATWRTLTGPIRLAFDRALQNAQASFSDHKKRATSSSSSLDTTSPKRTAFPR